MIRLSSRPRALLLSLAFALAPLFAAPAPAHAQTADVNAEARVYFERGNRLFEQAGRARGRRQRQLLEQALEAYVATLRIVRSRNALFNAAVVLEQLERPNEAFAYYTEYLAIPGLTEQERRDGEQRIGALRERVAVVALTSAPEGAQVFVDRLDLAPRGRTPLELALPPGRHVVFFRAPHHADRRLEVEAVRGERVEAEATLEAEPVEVVFELAGELGEAPTLTLDGEPIEPGRRELAAGTHVARLMTADGRAREERFVLEPGDEARTVRLEAPSLTTATLLVRSERPVDVIVDAAPVGSGATVRVEVPPGARRVEVRSEGWAPYTRLVTVEAGQTATLDVELGERREGRRLGAWPHVMLGLTAAAAASWAGVGVRALRLNDDFREQCPDAPDCQDRFDAVERHNLAADLLLGATGALAITTLILYLRNDRLGDAPGEGRLELSFGPGGGQVGWRGAF